MKIKRILFMGYKCLFYVIGIFLPKNEKMIVFESFLGKQYSDNPRAIYEYLKKHYPEYKLFWSFDRNAYRSLSKFPEKKLKRFSIKWLITMNRAKYWVSNSRMPLWIPKPRDTIYIQTWHGTPLKRLAVDMEEVHMPGTETEKYKKNFVAESSKWDYLISPNKYSTEIFKRAFSFEKEILETGYPRNDYLIQNNQTHIIKGIKQKLDLPLDKKVILYAPTWRDNQYYQIGRYKFEIPIDLKKMQEALGEEYIVLLRMHYLVAEDLEIQQYKDFVYDVSQHEDIRELYLIADILITDYSSVFFDYSNLKRPIIFYVHDIEEYRDNLRGFYFNIEETAPGELVKTTEGLIQEILLVDDNSEISNKMKHFYEEFCYLEDGNATERVVNKIFKHNE